MRGCWDMREWWVCERMRVHGVSVVCVSMWCSV